MMNINLDEIIYKWFDMKYKTYDKLEYKDSTYLYYDGNEYGEFLFDENSEIVFYSSDLYVEISNILPIEISQFESYIIKWAQDILNLTVKNTWRSSPLTWSLKIPK